MPGLIDSNIFIHVILAVKVEMQVSESGGDFPMAHLIPVPTTHVCRYLALFYKTTCTQQNLGAGGPLLEMQV